MLKYTLKRLIKGLASIVVVVAIAMILIYSMMDRNLIFKGDTVYSHQTNNQKVTYKYSKWEEYGYLDYVPYADYINSLDIDEDTRNSAVAISKTSETDSDLVKQYVSEFKKYYEDQGYTVVRLKAITKGKKVVNGGASQLFAYKDYPLAKRLWEYFSGLIEIDGVHQVKDDIEDRGLTFTLHDPAYGGDTFAPAIMGNGTKHKYLLYFDSSFPFIHQNMIGINLGTSYAVNKGIDVAQTMTESQGSYVKSEVIFPTGYEEMSADDLHSAVYASNSLAMSEVNATRFIDNYTQVETHKNGLSKMGYSFLIGIIASVLAYLLGVPIGVLMARKKDKLADKIGTMYIVFILAVPSLAYIFLIKAIGGKAGLPTTFDVENGGWVYFILPVISLAITSIADLMKWIRRYMIDQMNSDYVKFAKSNGLSQKEIYLKHILKNAIIPVVQGIPGTILGALIGAIITESVYVVPGAGNLLTQAINKYDNGVIIGMIFFYAILSVVSIVLGDVLMALVDPRITFTDRDR